MYIKNNSKKISRLVGVTLLLASFIFLTSCHVISKKVSSELQSMNKYPGVSAKDNSIASLPPKINVDDYKVYHALDSDNNPVAIAVAVSGGGYRASNFALGVMSGMEQIKTNNKDKNLLQAVTYYSSVSGGGFAVGFYMSQYSKYLQEHAKSKDKSKLFSLTSAISSDIAGPNYLNLDLQESVGDFGAPNKSKYASLLQSGVLSRGPNLKPLTLGDMFISKNSDYDPKLPIWIINSTIFQNLAILPFSPNVLSEYKVTGYYWDNILKKIAQPPKDSKSKVYAYSFPMAFAVAASASYPFALPSMTLESSACKGPCYLQLYDGGLADNLGVINALDILQQDSAKTKVLIVIDATQQEDQVFSESIKGPGTVSLLWGSLNASPDHMHIAVEGFMKRDLNDLLCSRADRVFMSYVSLKDDDKKTIVPTNLHLQKGHQKYLLEAGKKLVMKNKDVADAVRFINGDKTLGICKNNI
jgi:hypothetical protein